MSNPSYKYKRFLASLCIGSLLLLPVGCASGTSSESPVPQHSSVSETAAFSSFLDTFFKDYATSDSLSLHYTLSDPELLGINAPEVTLGEFGVDAMLASNQKSADYLTQLRTFSKDTLDEENRLLYELLEYALEHSTVSEEAMLYDSPLGPSTGLQTQLPILLAEYRFSSLKDVEEYFLLLEDLPNYFSDLCAFEEARSAADTQSCSEVLSRIVLQCKSFVEDPGNNFLIESFQDRLSVLPDLDATQIAGLCIRNQKLIFTKVIPAYEQLIETLESLSEPSVPEQGLAAFPEGASYYEDLVQSSTGSSRSMEEIEAMLEQAFKESMLTMVTLYASDSLKKELETYQNEGLHVASDSVVTEQETAATSDYSTGVLKQLQEQILTDFPAPADATFRVETVHPSLEEFISPALYLVPPLDSYKENVIYINRAKCASESLFSTLAHEGYPGHLYQNTYFASTSPHPVRMLLNFTGYDEGWGTYGELYSYRYADCSEELRQFLIAEQVAGLCLYSLSDIRIHYHGESKESVLSFLTEYGFSAENAEEVFYTQLGEPGIYLPYSVGYLELCKLRDRYLSVKEDDASLLTFHTFLLETGPAPFAILAQRLEQELS